MPPANGYTPSNKPDHPEGTDGSCETDRPALTAALGLAGRFLLPFDPAFHADHPAWRRAGAFLPVCGLFIGIMYAVVFSGVWRWLGEYQRIRFAPMAVLLVIDLGWLGYRLLQGLAAVWDSWRSRRTTSPIAVSPSLAAVVLVMLFTVLKYALLLSLPYGAKTWPADWREHLWFLYPYVIYRPLILMPLWGRWAVLLATAIGRIAPGESDRFTTLAKGSSLKMVMLYWLAASLLTVLYCSPDRNHIGWSLLIGLGILMIAYLASFALSRRFGGQTEATVMAVGAVVEFTFLLIYLPMARLIYWY